MRRAIARGGVLALAAGVALALPVAAGAKTTGYYDGVNTLYIQSPSAKERNEIEVSYNPTSEKFIVRDTAAGVKEKDPSPGPPCKKDGQVLKCTAPGALFGYMFVQVHKGKDIVDLDSSGSNAIPFYPSTVLAGAQHDDKLFGHNGPDTVNGGGAVHPDQPSGDDLIVGRGSYDRLFGEGGVDKLKANDGEADFEIDCGPGRDRDALFDVGLDPTPISC